MSSIRVHPISAEVAAHVRSTGTDPIYGYDYDVMRSTAGPQGYGPCRLCLRRFKEADERLLFLYNPFTSALGDFAGPIFICADPCTPYQEVSRFPEELRGIPLLLRAYDAHGHFVGETRPDADHIESHLEKLLQLPETAFVHLRNREARCFIARVVRGDTSQAETDHPDREGMRRR